MPSDWNLCDGDGYDVDGEGMDHCCYVDGVACTHLVIDDPRPEAEGRHFACGLRVELGDWDLVHADPRYIAEPKPTWDAVGMEDCGTWIGARGETMVSIRARGGITQAELVADGQCCFRRRWGADAPANRQRQAVRAINRWING